MLLGETPASLAMCRGTWPWTKVPPQGCGQTGWVGAGRSQTSQSCDAPARTRNALSNVQGSLPRSTMWVLAHVQQLPGLFQNPRSSIRLGPQRVLICLRQTRWMRAPFQIGRAPLTGFAVLECRFPLPYLVSEKKRGLFCLSLQVPET